jgi:hypothetical protein
VPYPQCGRYITTGSLNHHISHTDGHSIAFFRSNVSDESITLNDKAITSEIFADINDGGFLVNDDEVQVMNFVESLMENAQERSDARWLE